MAAGRVVGASPWWQWNWVGNVKTLIMSRVGEAVVAWRWFLTAAETPVSHLFQASQLRISGALQGGRPDAMRWAAPPLCCSQRRGVAVADGAGCAFESVGAGAVDDEHWMGRPTEFVQTSASAALTRVKRRWSSSTIQMVWEGSCSVLLNPWPRQELGVVH